MTLGIDKSRWTQDAEGTWLCLRSEDVKAVRQFCKKMEQGKKYTVEVRRYRAKRSLSANAYFWILAGKLAAATRKTTRDVYLHCIREIGDNFEAVVVEDKEEVIKEWVRIWAMHGSGREVSGWIVEDMGPRPDMPGYRELKCYYGSSAYSTRQMSCLIDSVVQECRQQDIETMTPDELALMKARWSCEI